MTLTCLCRSPSHSQRLLLTLNSQRVNGIFCDVIVCVDNKRFPLHRCVMAATSPKLRIMMLHMRPTDKVLHLNDVSLVGFKKIIKYIYTGIVKLSLEYAHHVLFAARSLQLRKLEKICLDYFKNVLHVNPDVTVTVSKLPADIHSLSNVPDPRKLNHEVELDSDKDSSASTPEYVDNSVQCKPENSNSEDLNLRDDQQLEDTGVSINSDVKSSDSICDTGNKNSIMIMPKSDSHLEADQSSAEKLTLSEDMSNVGGINKKEEMNTYDRNVTDHRIYTDQSVKTCCLNTTEWSADTVDGGNSSSAGLHSCGRCPSEHEIPYLKTPCLPSISNGNA